MAVNQEFRERVISALSEHTSIFDRPMFGGVGLYAGDLFFACLDDDRVYFKVDDTNRPDYVSAGMGPFLPFKDPERPMNGYYELPQELLKNSEELGVWLDKCLAVSQRAADKKARKATKSPR